MKWFDITQFNEKTHKFDKIGTAIIENIDIETETLFVKSIELYDTESEYDEKKNIIKSKK